MASGIVKRQGNRMDAVYEQPWGGVASNADPADIPPSCNTFADGIFIKNGRLCSASWNKSIAINYSKVAGQDYFSDIAPFLILRTILKPDGTYVFVTFSDVFGDAYIYDIPSGTFILDQQMSPLPTLGPIIIRDIQVIGGVAYVSLFECSVIYAYTPGVSFVPATTFVGGKYLCEILGYLITANTNQDDPIYHDTPPKKFNRYNWSVPFSYVDMPLLAPPQSAWNPAINRLAGFNTISEVQDEITQIFAMGNVGYILRDQGISQLTPTGQALAPFAVTPLWESQFGIGCTYPDTFDQYGSLAMWANDNNIYAFFNGSVPQEITGSAKAAIFADINIATEFTFQFSYISGAFFNCSENSVVPELAYCLSIVYVNSTVGSPLSMTGIFWVLNLASKVWTRQVVDLLSIVRGLTGEPTLNFVAQRAKVQGVLYTQGGSTGRLDLNVKRIIGVLTFYGPNEITGAYNSFMLPFFNSDTGQPVLGGGDISPNCDVQFKQEEVRLGTQPTVRGVLVKTAGSGQLNVSVSGVVFTPITVNSPTAKTYRSSGVYSGENPQLNVFGTNFSGVIVKANMLMTYEEGEPL